MDEDIGSRGKVVEEDERVLSAAQVDRQTGRAIPVVDRRIRHRRPDTAQEAQCDEETDQKTYAHVNLAGSRSAPLVVLRRAPNLAAMRVFVNPSAGVMTTIRAIDLPCACRPGTLVEGEPTRALEVPAMNHDLDHVMKITHRPPTVMAEGSGSWLRDSEGREYLDFVQGWAVNCLGHPHPVVLEALQVQAQRLINCSPAYHNEPMARLASLLADSSGLDAV